MVETRLQERSLTEHVDEIRSLHEVLAAEVKSQNDSLNARFDRLEAMMFNGNHLQAPGKAPMDPGPSHPPTPINHTHSHPPTPINHTPSRPPDPPDLNGYPRRGDLTDYHQQGNYGRLTSRLSKIIFPAFDGTELRDWLSKCEQFFDIDGTPPELKVRLAAMHLTGKATKWHHNYMSTRYGLFPSWTEYIVEISARFSKLFDDPLAELVALKQGSDSVITFLDKFETARMRLVLPEAHALSIFLANMNPHLSLHTRQFEVTSIASAAKIASLHESSLSHIPQKTRAPFNPYQRPFHKNTPPTTPNEATDTQKPNFIPRNNPDKPPRKYSYQEMQDRRSKGLCMFCDEPFTPGHQLKHKRSQIYVMECDDVDYTSDDNSSDTEQHATTLVAAAINNQPDEAPVLSINAINGSTSYNCMRLVGHYGQHKLHILVDPGSTHNFLDVNIASQLGCQLESTKPMSVKAATGDTLLTNYKNLKLP
ncbi:hypothetical protein F2Q69_00024854 [Brassica cretica]|uniref:Retrotransposon gag domain-containing protein n=1 Tax=Brassica cretica TaxID=69181 RepID=A0A8S9Q3S4_BRACR|nr:hypothetical protein F2Q69_00024854 [Brassica cretica]